MATLPARRMKGVQLNKSQLRPFFMGSFGALIGGLIAGTILFFAFKSSVGSDTTSSQDGKYGNQTGMQLISSFGCKPGETKQVYIRGLEDNYSLQGNEKSRTHERLKALPGLAVVSAQPRDYDEGGYNKIFSEYFELPPNISDGIYVTRMKGFQNNTNDTYFLGDHLDRDSNMADMARHMLSVRISELHERPGWQKVDDLYFARLSDIEFYINNSQPNRKFAGLLDYIQAQSEIAYVDITVSDDTIVDFNAMAVCERPIGNRGVTLTTHGSALPNSPELTVLSCNADVRQVPCNPYYGDVLCREELPVACFEDLSLPFPDTLEPNKGFSDHWSGGKIGYTSKVRGDSFATIQDVNAFCASQFNANWRPLSWHDGGSTNVLAYNYKGLAKGRAWTDIVDQPDATCWSRDSQETHNHEDHN